MADLDAVASRVRQGLVEMAETLRVVEQPELAQLAERMAEQLRDAIYESLDETNVDIRLTRTATDGSTVEELEAVADKMRKLRKSLKDD